MTTWIMPLHTNFSDSTLYLFAPNSYVLNYIKQNLSTQIETLILAMDVGVSKIHIEIGSYGLNTNEKQPDTTNHSLSRKLKPKPPPYSDSVLKAEYTFETHVEGKSNQLARAAALQAAQNPGRVEYNPLFIYGGVGLGKTHLMQATGNLILINKPKAKVVYVHSEVFVSNMVNAIKSATMEKFKRYYRSLDALLIDDIQFFAGKKQSQEEFFHTYNTLVDSDRQVIITSDQLPQSLDKIDNRLISRFAKGLTISIDPPELETRVAILENKALEYGVELPSDVTFFVAGAIHSNVRELEGALHNILIYSNHTGRSIDINLVREALKNILLHQKKQISIENIQQTIVEYYNIRTSDLISKNRSRSVARPRQIAMLFTRELTTMSLPEIGNRFGGRDHSTVMYACKQIKKLLESDLQIKEDYNNLQRLFGR